VSVNRPVEPLRRGRPRRRRLLSPRAHHPVTGVSGGGAQPPTGTDNSLRWRRGRPAYYGVEWPFWLLMLSPWLAWGILLLLAHLGVCLICLPR
jgi:hypothetical protein